MKNCTLCKEPDSEAIVKNEKLNGYVHNLCQDCITRIKNAIQEEIDYILNRAKEKGLK